MNSNLIQAAQCLIKTTDRDLGAETVASVVITGLAVVFIALIILIALVWAYGQIFEIVNKKSAAKEESQKAEALKKAEPEKPAPAVVEDTSADEEITAVIAAAIAAYGEQTGQKLKIKSIKPTQSGVSSRNAWSTAGLLDSTRPF